jgi:ParB-like chromosome segregation protein Spo0J
MNTANLTDAEAMEAALIENLQRRDVHPLEEAQGFKALLNLEEPKYSIEQIAAKVGKSPAYIASRANLTQLAAPVVEAFYADEIGVGHALLLAKLQPAQQEQALTRTAASTLPWSRHDLRPQPAGVQLQRSCLGQARPLRKVSPEGNSHQARHSGAIPT